MSRMFCRILLITSLIISVSATPTASATCSDSPKQTREVISDPHGRNLGEIRPGSNKRLEARDRYGLLLGTYDLQRKETRDRHGRLLAKGNILSALIMKAAEEKR